MGEKQHQQIENEIWKLFKGLCVICGGKASDIHHLKFRSSVPDDLWDKDNLVTLCNSCHSLLHSDPAVYTPKAVAGREILLSVLY